MNHWPGDLSKLKMAKNFEWIMMQVTGANQTRKKIAIYWFGEIILTMKIDVSKTCLLSCKMFNFLQTATE